MRERESWRLKLFSESKSSIELRLQSLAVCCFEVAAIWVTKFSWSDHFPTTAPHFPYEWNTVWPCPTWANPSGSVLDPLTMVDQDTLGEVRTSMGTVRVANTSANIGMIANFSVSLI